MKQVLRKGLSEVVVEEIPEPEAAAHHVLIRPVCSLISSGTESASIHREGLVKEVAGNPSHLQKIWNVMKVQGPLRTAAEVRAKLSSLAVIGYSGAGYVAAVHPTVTDLKAGDRVAYGGEGTGHAETIRTGRNLVARMPAGVAFEQAAFATLGSIAMHAVRTANIGLGDTVAVIGLGLVGQLVAQLARLQGAVVIGIDLKPERAELAHKTGADFAVSNAIGESVAGITEGRGADCVIVAAAAKSAGPCHQALEICRDRGRIVIVGAVDVQFPWYEIYLKEIEVRLSRAYGPGSYDPVYEIQGADYPLPYVRWTENRNMEEFLRLCQTGKLDTAALVSHRFALDNAPQAYDTVMDAQTSSLAVLLDYPRANDPLPETRVVRIPGSTPAPGKVGVALSGAAGLARWMHLPNLKQNPAAGLRAVYSGSGVRAKDVGARFGAAYCTTRYQDVLDDAQTHMVLITSRNQHHAKEALAALRAGKHVFVEKPMALLEEECRELARAVAESGCQLTVGFNRRFAPYYRDLKKQLVKRAGPAVIQCRVNSPGISGSFWMADPAIGGAILGEACHFIDLLYWLLESEPLTVAAYSLPTGVKDPIGENNIVASFHFADGSIANLTYCTVGPKSGGGERVEVFAPGIRASSEDFQRFDSGQSWPRKKARIWPDKGYAAQLNEFIACIQTGTAPSVTVRDGVRSTIGCLRMMEAARTGQPQPMDWERALV